MSGPSGSITTPEPGLARVDGARARGTWLRYAAAWLAAAAPLFFAMSAVELLDDVVLRVVVGLLMSGAAVVLSFVLGLPLRIRAMGRDWNRYGWPVGVMIAAALAAQFWARELTEWLYGMESEILQYGRDSAAIIAVGGWFAAVFLLANFPCRARIGLRFAETFSTERRRWLWRGGLAAAVTAALWAVVPVPLLGYWHTPFSDCLCESKNLIVFEDGKVFQWASAHGLAREPLGTYRRHFWGVTWDTGKEKIELRPGWFFMRLRAPEYGSPSGRTRLGYREWRSDYIREVLATKPAPQPAPGEKGKPVPSTAP